MATEMGAKEVSDQVWILAVFFVYFGIIISLAFHFRKSQNLADYYLGGRKLNPWVGALSAQTSDMSGWLLMGLPGAIYAAGTGRAWIAVGLIIGTVLNWCFVAKKLRRYTIVAKNSVTLPEYFQNRFHDTSHILKITSAVFFAIFFTVYAASGFVAGGTLLPQIFDINYHAAVVILASFVVLYTLIGGLMAISWTDSIQGMMMLCAVFFLPIIVIANMGGWGNVYANIPPGFFDMMSDGQGGQIAAVSIISDMAWGLGYFGMPHILIKLIAIEKEKYVSRSAVIAIVWVLLALGSAVVVGLVGRAFMPGLANPETVFIHMVRAIFFDHGALWAVLIGSLFLCGMFAAIKSTADSQLLVGSSAVADIYRVANKKATDTQLVWFSRGAVFVVAALAIWIALDAYDPALGGPNRSTGVMVLVAMAWAGFGSAFGPLVLCSLFWKRTNRAGAIAGVIVGGSTVIIWQYIPLMDGATLAAYTRLFSLVPGFFLSLLAIVVVSLVTKPPSAAILEEFEVASKPMND
ncbi:MAG: sodium/proline symporter [Oscillospiraceae bacterium]|nr:sodium/proline symporter [Oscillospiraceae bacterium]